MKSGSTLGSVRSLAWKSNTGKSTRAGKWNCAQSLEDVARGVTDGDQPLVTAGERS